MGKTIGVEKLQKNYNDDMTKIEEGHEVAKTFVDTRYAGKRTEGYGKSKGALNEAYVHVKNAGSTLRETGKATVEGIEKVIIGTAMTVGAPIIGTLIAGYETVFEGGYDTLKSAVIAGDAAITTRTKAFGEKRALGGKLKDTKVRATLAYAAAAQAEIDTLNGEVVPFEERVAALRAEIKQIETAAGAIKGDKFDMVVERDALISKAAELKKPWYRKLI